MGAGSRGAFEVQDRLQVARIDEVTEDKGVHDMRSFLLARDTVHQRQWIAAAQELPEEGYEDLPVPSNFPLKNEASEVKYQFMFSVGQQAADGRWASSPTPDGNGHFSYIEGPNTSAPMPPPTNPDPRFFGTTPEPNLLDKAKSAVKDAVQPG